MLAEYENNWLLNNNNQSRMQIDTSYLFAQLRNANNEMSTQRVLKNSKNLNRAQFYVIFGSFPFSLHLFDGFNF